MYLVNINRLEATNNKPFRFLIELAKCNPIPEALQSFVSKLPNPDDEFDYYNKYPYNISNDKLSFTIEWQEQNLEYVDEYENHISYSDGEWKAKTYSFVNELHGFLYEKYIDAKKHLTNHWNEKELNKDSGETFEKWVSTLCNCILSLDGMVEVPDEFKTELVRPYKACIRFMRENYRKKFPKHTKFSLELQELLAEILTEKSTNNDIAPFQIRSSVCSELVKLIDPKTGSPFFKFDQPNETLTNLGYFLSGNFHLIKKPINFNDKIVAAHCAISMIADIKGYTAPQMQAANIFTFKGRPFKKGVYDKHKSAIKKHEPPDVKFVIQSMRIYTNP